jgi:hypothetical protein
MVAMAPPTVRTIREASAGKLVPVMVISVPTVADSGEIVVTVKLSDGSSSSSLQETKANSAKYSANILRVVFIIIEI